MTPTRGPVYEFGEFQLLPEDGQLLKNGEPIPLTLKAFSTLVQLVQRHGNLVTKTELLEKVWDNAFVEEAAVSRCIWTIRNALGVDSKSQQFIKTVPKRGYRFVAEVIERNGDVKPTLMAFDGTTRTREVVEPGIPTSAIMSGTQSSNLAVSPQPISETVLPFPARVERTTTENGPNGFRPMIVPPRRVESSRSRVFGILAGAVIVTFAAAIGLYMLFRPPTQVVSNGPKRVAVLPLRPVNPENREPRLEFAVAESIILKLSESKDLVVSRLSAVRKFVELETDPVEAGRELNVEYVLTSNYQLDDGRVRVTSQLIDVRTGAAQQTFKSETDAASIFAIQDAIANEIGNAFLVNFGAQPSIYAARRGTDNEEAYNLYQQAWFLIDKNSAQGASAAAKLLDRAVEIDPNYSQAWAVRSLAYCQFAHLGGAPPDSVFSKAAPMLEKAISLDASNAMAFTVRGSIYRDYYWNVKQAKDDLRKAIELDPGLAVAHRLMAGVYYREGNIEQAIESQKRALDLNPTSTLDHWYLGTYLVAAGRTEEGIEKFEQLIQMGGNAEVFSYHALWRIYSSMGNEAAAFEAFMKFSRLNRVDENLLTRYTDAYKARGWKGVLRTELERMVGIDPGGKYSPTKIFVAELAAQLGESDIAFKYLEEARVYRAVEFSEIHVMPTFASLRGDPRFQDMLKRAGITPLQQPFKVG